MITKTSLGKENSSYGFRVHNLASVYEGLDRFEEFNVFNANAVSREQYGFNPGAGAADQYLTPLGLQPGRLAKISLQYNF